MSAATKATALILMLRVLHEAFPQEAHLWTIVLAVLACASLAIGNLAALVQRNVKRMLAYSSISQAGFMLIADRVEQRPRRAGSPLLPDPVLRDVASARSRSSRRASASSGSR